MSKRISLKDKPKDSFFNNTQTLPNINDTELKRKTYYMTGALSKALALMSVNEGINISEIVRNIIEKNIPQHYLDEANKLVNK